MSGDTTDHLGTSDTLRLYIAPFNPELLDKIIAPPLRPLANDISFHTIQTFPERGFGYVTLPKMEAQKLKTKLNGSTLKGSKIKIEEAKPGKKRKSDDEADGEDRKARKAAKKEKKRQGREKNVIAGYELEEGRHIKRGWTEDGAASKSAKKKSKSQAGQSADAESTGAVEGKKLRFKATVSPIVTPTEAKHKDKSKSRKDTDGMKRKKTVVVEEFRKSTSLPSSSTHARNDSHHALAYEDGKGWLDEERNVVEAERHTDQRSRGRQESRVSAIESREEASEEPKGWTRAHDDPEDDEMSVDGEDQEDRPEIDSFENAVENDSDAPSTSAPAKEVHPLETLFKRPVTGSAESKHRPKPIDTAFSFFDTETAAEDGEIDNAAPPQTPRTKRDMEWRGLRSAAPTPDTAAIGRHFSFPFGKSDDEDEEDDIAEDDAAAEDADTDNLAPGNKTGAPDQGDESAFRKWFYKNRGEFNRGWKKRRRDERKVVRQRENRRLSRKVA